MTQRCDCGDSWCGYPSEPTRDPEAVITDAYLAATAKIVALKAELAAERELADKLADGLSKSPHSRFCNKDGHRWSAPDVCSCGHRYTLADHAAARAGSVPAPAEPDDAVPMAEMRRLNRPAPADREDQK